METGPVETPPPPALDPRLCVSVPPEPGLPESAGLVAPVTPAERAAMLSFILWTQAVLDWGRELAGRADLAAAACDDEAHS